MHNDIKNEVKHYKMGQGESCDLWPLVSGQCERRHAGCHLDKLADQAAPPSRKSPSSSLTHHIIIH